MSTGKKFIDGYDTKIIKAIDKLKYIIGDIHGKKANSWVDCQKR